MRCGWGSILVDDSTTKTNTLQEPGREKAQRIDSLWGEKYPLSPLRGYSCEEYELRVVNGPEYALWRFKAYGEALA